MKTFGTKMIALLAFCAALFSPAIAQDTTGGPRRTGKKLSKLFRNICLKTLKSLLLPFRNCNAGRHWHAWARRLKTIGTFWSATPNVAVLGNPDGDVTIVEFFDYRCEVSAAGTSQKVMKLVKEDGNIRFIPRQFPILDRPGDPPVSNLAARAALAAHKQGKFEEFHVATMTSNGTLTEEGIYDIARKLGLNIAQLQADMNDRLVVKSVQNTLAIGQDIGFEGTPGILSATMLLPVQADMADCCKAVNRARREKKQQQPVGKPYIKNPNYG